MKFSLPFKGRVAILATISIFLTFRTQAQVQEIHQAVYSDISKPLRDIKVTKAPFWKKWATESEKQIPNKFHIRPVIHPEYMNQADAAIQQSGLKSATAAVISPAINFDGLDNSDNTDGRVTPPDPAGDVGPNDYVQAVNSMLQVFSKTGVSKYGPVPTSTLWNNFPGAWSGHNDGDAIVMYDEVADRWIISQFAVDCGTYPNYTEYELVAVSQTADPLGAYYRYAFQFDYMPDYPKMGIWRDGYYLSVNRFNTNNSSSPFIGAAMCVLERDKMLAGDPAARMIYIKTETLGGSGSSLGTDCSSMLPGDCDGTFAPAGTPNYFTYINDDSWGGNDELRIWSLKPDWNANTAAYSFVTALPVAAFATYSSYAISQKGVSLKLDDLSDRLMYRLQYRNMGTYESMVTCHTVNSGSNIAGVRWYEMRKNGASWTLYQQGTYAFADNKSRWLGSIAMNGSGDIALGYTLSGTNDFPSIYFTGRKSTDALGTMTIAESPVKIGAASMTGADRWGDYAMMSIDPTDNKTFWHTNLYVGTYGGSYPWATRIASFVFTNDPLVTTLQATSINATSATLNGKVNPNGLAATYYFKWGATASYGNVTPTLSAGSGSADVPVSAAITGLTAGTTYHFCLVATNSDGTTTGSDLTFIAGQAEVITAAIINITATTATGGGNVTTDGGSTVTRGICWSLNASPTIADAHTTDGTGTGTYTSSLTGLTPGNLYHVRAYVTNTAGTVYGNEVTFTSTALAAPVATAGTNIMAETFTANWNAVDGATSYFLDVSLYPTFSIGGGTSTLSEGFDAGFTAPAGWTFTNIGGTYTTTGNYGLKSPSLKLDGTGDAVETPTLSSAATELAFWCKGQSTNAESALLIEGYNGSSWVTIDNLKPLPTTSKIITYNSSSSPALPAGIVKFRLSYSKGTGNLALDDMTITSGGTVPAFLNGYENLLVNGTSQNVNSLVASTSYYYRVRARNGNSQSDNSNVISVTTTDGGTTPTLYVSPASLSAFTYQPGSGPSTSKSFSLSGTHLTGAPGNITVTGSTNYEVSADNITFGATTSVAYSSATLAATPVYVRLKAGLAEGNYIGELVSNAGGGAGTTNVICNGNVSVQPTPAIATGNISSFGDVAVNSVSSEKVYQVSGTDLTSDIIISPPAGFEISTTSGSGFVAYPNTISLAQTAGIVPSTTIYVRFSPTGQQAYSGNIVHSSTGAVSQNVAVSGTGIASVTPLVVISQVYGGGGNSGATYKNDFIELYNRGTSAVNLNGWSVQYASATGTTWAATPLTNFTLAPGQYYLVQQAKGSGGTVDLPTPDAIGTLAMSGSNGKVALVSATTPLSGTCATGTTVIDFVGYGSTANCSEGSGPTASTTNTTGVLRASNGCTDNNDNKTDFATAAPSPRNSATTISPCVLPSPVLTVTPSSLSGLVYVEENGPSAAQSYTLSGSYLTGAPGIITVTGSANFEISVDNNTFLNSLSIPYSSSDLINTTVYVRLKAGLPAGSYNNELITHAGGGAVSVAVTCSGSISLAPLAPVALSATQVTSNSFTANWNASAAATGYQLDVATDNGFMNFVPGFNNLDVNNVTTYPVNGLAVKTPYFYRVRAYNNNAESENSNIISLNTLQDNTGFNFDESAASDAYTFQKTLFVNIKDNARGDIYIYTVGGKLVYSTPAVQGISRFYLNEPGVYVIKVLTTKVNMSKKVVIR